MHEPVNRKAKLPRSRTFTRTSTLKNGSVTVRPTNSTKLVDVDRETRSAYFNNPVVDGWRKPSPYTRVLWNWEMPQIDGTREYVRRGPTSNPAAEVHRLDAFTGYAFQITQPPCYDSKLTSVPTSWEHDAELRALAQLAEANANVSEMLVEIRKTCESIANRSFGTLLGFQHLFARDWRGALKRWGVRYPPKSKVKSLKRAASVAGARGVAGLVLETNYAWLPLMSDLHALIGNVDGKIKRSFRYGCKGVIHRPIREFPVQRNMSAYTAGSVDCYALATGFRGCKVRFDVEVDFNAVRTAREWGLVNPAHAVWVSVPSSHVVDWFLPVSDWLVGLSALLPGTRLIGGTVTNYVRYNLTSYSAGKHTKKYDGIYDVELRASVSGGGSRYRRVDRRVYTSLPVPKFVLRNPLTSLERGANQIAQLVQLLLKRQA